MPRYHHVIYNARNELEIVQPGAESREKLPALVGPSLGVLERPDPKPVLRRVVFARRKEATPHERPVFMICDESHNADSLFHDGYNILGDAFVWLQEGKFSEPALATHGENFGLEFASEERLQNLKSATNAELKARHNQLRRHGTALAADAAERERNPLPEVRWEGAPPAPPKLQMPAEPEDYIPHR